MAVHANASKVQRAAIDVVRELYVQLWQAVFDLYNYRHGGAITQASLAKDLEKNPSVISRLMSGRNIPRSLDLVVDLAAKLDAKPREIRVLLAGASAISCDDAGEKSAVPYLANFFAPLFDEQSFGRKLFSVRSVAQNVLLDLGVERGLAAQVAARLPDDPSEAMLALVFEPPPELRDVMKNTSVPKLSALRNTYSQIVVGECDEPPRVKELIRAVRAGAKIGTWSRIPNITVTRISLPAGQSVSDHAHDGYEFLFVVRGRGEFKMAEFTGVQLDDQGRPLIAYRPSASHTFTARDVETTLYVLSYVRGTDNADPAADVLKVAQAELDALRRASKKEGKSLSKGKTNDSAFTR